MYLTKYELLKIMKNIPKKTGRINILKKDTWEEKSSKMNKMWEIREYHDSKINKTVECTEERGYK